MATELATGYIDLVPSASGIGKKIAEELDLDRIATEQGKIAGDNLSKGLLGGAEGTGKKLAVALGLAAVGAFAIKSAVDVQDAQNIIIRSTGATGKAAEGLEESFRNVASGSAASFETVSTTLAELYQRTGLQGKALEGLTSQVVTFNRISKDSPITVDALTKALAGFNVPGEKMGQVLDHLFIISQKTGVPLSEILGTMQTAGPIARQFGLSVEDTAGLLAKLNKAGVDANQILPGLKKVFKDAADAGKDPQEALRGVITQIDALVRKGDEIGARNLAVQVFGPRGVGLVDAVLAGKLTLDDFNKSINVTGDGILETGNKTGTLSGALGVLRNNLQLALAEFAKPALDAANDALRAILPTIKDIASGFASLPDSVKIGAVAAVGLLTQLGNIGQFAEGLGAIKSFGSTIATGFQLAAVKALELGEAFTAMGVAGALSMTAATLGIGAVIGLTIAALSSSGASDRAAASAKKWVDVQLSIARGSGGEKDAVKSLSVELDALAGRIDRLKAKQLALPAGGDPLTATFAGQEVSTRKLADAIRNTTARHDALESAIRKVKDQIEAEKQKAEETARSLNTYTVAVAAGKDATDAFGNLTDEARTKLQDLTNTVIAAQGGQLGYEASLRSIDKAQLDYNLAVFAFGEVSPQAIEAQAALSQAQLSGITAADQLDTANRNLQDTVMDPTAYTTTVARLEALKQKYPELAAQYQAQIDKLGWLHLALVILPDKKEIPVTTPGVDDAIQKFRDLIALVDTSPDLIAAGANPLGFLTPHAEGGVFTRAHVGLLAEAGAEAVLPLKDPSRSWELIAQSGLLDTISVPRGGGSGGEMFHVENINYNGPLDDPARRTRQITADLNDAKHLMSLG